MRFLTIIVTVFACLGGFWSPKLLAQGSQKSPESREKLPWTHQLYRHSLLLEERGLSSWMSDLQALEVDEKTVATLRTAIIKHERRAVDLSAQLEKKHLELESLLLGEGILDKVLPKLTKEISVIRDGQLKNTFELYRVCKNALGDKLFTRLMRLQQYR